MKNGKMFVVLVLAVFFVQGLMAAPRHGITIVDDEKFELGLQMGVGFHLGNSNPVAGVTRVYQNALRVLANEFPIMETYGLSARYSFDCSWAIQLQGMRQRLYFRDGDLNGEGGSHFYNAMWDIDVMAEYNFLKYGLRAHRPKNARGMRMRVFPATPFVTFGLGVALSNKHVPARMPSNAKYPLINPTDGNLATSLYVPVGLGVKWRMAYNWQLKAVCQYHLGVGRDPSGGTMDADRKHIIIDYKNINAGLWHNVVLGIGVVYSFGEQKHMLSSY